MTTPDMNQIAEVMSRLQTNYSNIARSWYDIFYNTVAQDVSLEIYDEDGTLTTYTIPNRAKDFNYIKNGNGVPENNVVGTKGNTYQDLSNGNLYIKASGTGNTGWKLIALKDDVDNILQKGAGTPEGHVVATIGALYIDTTNGELYIKQTSTGNTGWVNRFTEEDPIFTASAAYNITGTNITNWGTAYTNTHTHANKTFLDTLADAEDIYDAIESYITSGSDPDVVALTSSSGTKTLTANSHHTLTVGGTTTIALPTISTTNKLTVCSLKLTNGSTTYTITQPAGVKWRWNSTPALTTASTTYTVSYWTDNNGTTWYGKWAQEGT